MIDWTKPLVVGKDCKTHTPGTPVTLLSGNAEDWNSVRTINGEIFTLWKSNGDRFRETSQWVKSGFFVENANPVEQTDQELASQLRKLDEEHLDIFLELQKRGYTLESDDGDNLEATAIGRIYKEHDL